MRVKVSENAQHDMRGIHSSIALDNPVAADRILATIRRSFDNLSRFPKIGRIGKFPGTRQLSVPRSPYIIVYHLKKDCVFIVRIIHGAMKWPPEEE